jgi:DNA mismatch repair protein MutS2
MIKHTYHVLEFYKLLQILSGYASCPLGQSDCLSLTPSKDRKVIENEQRLVSEMKLLLKLKGFLPLEGLIDIGPITESCRAEGSYLEPDSILSILRTVEAAEQAKKSILSQHHIYPGLYDLVKDMSLCGELRESINKSIHPNGSIRDSASHTLKKLRRKKTELRRELQKRLEEIKGVMDTGSEGDDHLISIRDGRYVIPLRTDRKHRLQGIVHDYSHTHATCFFEPIEVMDDNNRISELNHLEKEEELKVLLGLTAIIRSRTEDLICSQTILGKLDGLYARARLSNDLNGVRPIMGQDGKIELRKAINPILACIASKGEAPVPLDILLDRDVNVMVISGPNRGGKTVTLKTLGLLSLMAHAGLHIPAEEGSMLPVFNNILAEIGDDQDIQAGQSTFSAHISHLRYMIEHADKDSLIIIDEPGMGTDPDEGSALAMALLDDLARRDALMAVSTHYNRLKTYGLLEKRAKNACMEYDDIVGRPTFSLRYGTPGTSYALEVASKHGIGQDLLTRARGYLDKDEVRLNRLIDKLNRLRYETEIEKSKAEHVRQKYASAREKMLKALGRVEDNRKEILLEKRYEADKLIKEAREEIKILISSFKEKERPSQAFIQKRYDDIAGRLIDNLPVPEDKGSASQDKVLRTGQMVRHRGLNLEGRILSLDAINSKAMIITGNVKLSVKTEDLMVISGEAGLKSYESSGGISHRISGTPARDINLIGYKVEDALSLIDRIMDRSMIEGDMSIRIIHGHGTGKLKAAIRDHLRSFSCVKRVVGEDPEYGGEAITIVELN